MKKRRIQRILSHILYYRRDFFMFLGGICLGFGAALLFDTFRFGVSYKIREYLLFTQPDSYGSQKTLIKGFTDIPNDFDLYWQVYSVLKHEYVDPSKLDDKKMYYGSIKGLVKSVGDLATVFFDPAEYKEYKEALSGEYEGIGAILEPAGAYVRIVGVFEGAPAYKAGLKAGDIVIEVNGKSISGESIVSIVKKIRGPKGTQVRLTIVRPSEHNKRITVEIIRDKIDAPSMRFEVVSTNIGLLRISRFSDNTFDSWKLELTSYMGRIKRMINSGQIEALIIDLRGNPGGFLAGAIEFLSYFLKPNTIVVFQETRKGIVKTYHTNGVRELSIPISIPVVVLVDSSSASASEIVAGVLQHYKRAYIIGTKTFGKGTVQTSKEFKDGSMLKYTIAYWLLPNKQRLTPETPVVPDLEIKFEEKLKIEKGIDNQLEAAIEYLGSKLK